MTEDALKLTVYFGESDRVGHELVCDALLDLFADRGLEVAVLLRGIAGFGIKHRLHTERILTLSEDLPLVAVAVDTRERILAVLDDVRAVVSTGTITLERASLVHAEPPKLQASAELGAATKLTVYCGRAERIDGRAGYVALVEEIRACGVAGATVLLGLDGMFHGQRRRARFVSRNLDVPLMIICVGDTGAIQRAIDRVSETLRDPIATIERVHLCKHDGVLLDEPRPLAPADDEGLALYQKLMVYCGEQARYEGHSLYTQVVHELRQSGAAGATALRGIWGYSHDGRPHGDRLFSLRRHVPIVITLVDEPGQMRDSWEIVHRLTADAGLVTSEIVPTFHATGPDIEHGSLRLARPGRRS